MNALTLAAREFKFDQKSFWRDPQTVFFTIGLPLLYLFIFATIFGDGTAKMEGQVGKISGAQFYVAGIIVIGIISATFQNLTAALVLERESGNLKRLRSTPLPTAVFIAGHVATVLLMSLLLSAFVLILGRVAYNVAIPSTTMPAFVVTLLVGSISLSCLAFAATMIILKQRAATPVLTAITLTLFFISGNFFMVDGAPAALTFVADLFPVRHLNQAMWTIFNPHTPGAGFLWSDIGIVALWGVAGLLVAIRYFRWNPTGD